jgi:hypothetical protein
MDIYYNIRHFRYRSMAPDLQMQRWHCCFVQMRVKASLIYVLALIIFSCSLLSVVFAKIMHGGERFADSHL